MVEIKTKETAKQYKLDLENHVKKIGYGVRDMQKEQDALFEYIDKKIIKLQPNNQTLYINIKTKADIQQLITVVMMGSKEADTNYCIRIDESEVDSTHAVYEDIYSSIGSKVDFSVICNHEDTDLMLAFMRSANKGNLYLSVQEKPIRDVLKTLTGFVEEDNRVQIYKEERNDTTIDLGVNKDATATIRNWGMVSSATVDVKTFHEELDDGAEMISYNNFLESYMLAVRATLRGTLKGISPTTKVFHVDKAINVVFENLESLVNKFGIDRVISVLQYAGEFMTKDTVPTYTSVLRIASPLGLSSCKFDVANLTDKYKFKELMELREELQSCFLNPIRFSIPMSKKDWIRLPEYLYKNWDDYELVVFYDKN